MKQPQQSAIGFSQFVTMIWLENRYYMAS